MRLWRISDYTDLSGEGGLKASGRWHTKGFRVVYLSDHSASALLETMVHLEIDAEDLPDDYQLLGVEVPDDLRLTSVDVSDLPADWREDQSITRAFGDNWLRAGATALMRVPSAIVPECRNYLLNPTHADVSKISISSKERAAYDPRLIAFRES